MPVNVYLGGRENGGMDRKSDREEWKTKQKKPRENPTQRSWAEQKRTQDTHGVQGRCEAHSQSSSPCMRHGWQSLLDELVVIKTRTGIKIQSVILTIRARDLQQRGWKMQHSGVQSWFIPIFIVLFLVSLSSVYLWVKSRLGSDHTSHHVWVFMMFRSLNRIAFIQTHTESTPTEFQRKFYRVPAFVHFISKIFSFILSCFSYQ